MKIGERQLQETSRQGTRERVGRFCNLTVCGVIAPREGVIEKTHVSRHRGIDVRFYLNNP